MIGGSLFVTCPACGRPIAVHRHSAPDAYLDDVDYDRAHATVHLHLRHGCTHTAAAAHTTRLHRPP